MATRKTTKKTTKTTKKSSKNAPRRKKTAPKKATSRKPKARAKKKAPKKKKKATRKKAAGDQTATLMVAQLLPKPVETNRYVRRTIEILDDGERRRTQLRRQNLRRLAMVWRDLQKDVERTAQKNLQTLTARVRKAPVAKELIAAPTRVTAALDLALDRVGLVRKSVYLAAVAKSRRRLPAKA